MSERILVLHNVQAGYDPGEPVIVAPPVVVRAGEVNALVGDNASGKTTLYRGLFNRPEVWLEGTVLWCGQPVRNLRDPRVPKSAVAWVRQDRPRFESFTVEETLRVVLPDWGHESRQKFKRLKARLPEIVDLLDRSVMALSGGQQALLALAVGLVRESTLLCLDEPAANLDARGVSRLQEVLRRYVKECGAGCLVIEHREEFLAGCDWRFTLDAISGSARTGNVSASWQAPRPIATSVVPLDAR